MMGGSNAQVNQQQGANGGQLTIDNLWKILASEKPADAKPVPAAPTSSRKEFNQCESNLFGAQACNADKQSVAGTQASEGGLLPPFSLGMSNKKFSDQLNTSPACPTTAAKTEFRTPMSNDGLFATPNGQKGTQYNGQAYIGNQQFYTPAGHQASNNQHLAFSTPGKDGQEFRNNMPTKTGAPYGYSMAENCDKDDELVSREQPINFAAKSNQD